MSDDAVRGEADLAGKPAEDVSGEPGAPVPVHSEGPLDADLPWGVGEDSPMDEGSEPVAVPEGQRGERRAGEAAHKMHRPNLGPTEPIQVPEAGPGGPHEPSPPHRPFPADDDVM